MTRTYVILPIEDITSEMISDSLNSETSFRMSLDCTCGILKFDHLYPNSVKGYKKYSQDEMRTYLIDNIIDWESGE